MKSLIESLEVETSKGIESLSHIFMINFEESKIELIELPQKLFRINLLLSMTLLVRRGRQAFDLYRT